MPTTSIKRDAWRSEHFYQGAAERAAVFGFELEEFWLREPRMTGRRMSQLPFGDDVQDRSGTLVISATYQK